MKICFMIPGFSDGGAQKQCIYLLNELQKRPDVELSLIRFHKGVHDALLETDRLDIREFEIASNYNLRAVKWAAGQVKKIQPDVIMSWLHSSDVYSFAIRLMNGGPKWVMTERNSSYPNEPRFILRNILGRSADAIVSNSTAGDEFWKNKGAKGARFVSDNIVPGLDRKGSGAARSKTVLHVGRLEDQKNVLVLAQAFAALAARRTDLNFQLVGDGSLRGEVEAIIEKAGVQDRVKLLGFRKDVFALMNEAGLLVSLSHHEGLPNVLLEGVVSGVPIVASNIREHRDLLGDTYPFYIAERDNPEIAAAMMERVLDTRDAAGHLSFAKKRTEKMTAKNIADQYIDIFKSVVSS